MLAVLSNRHCLTQLMSFGLYVRTSDHKLRIFISSTLKELAPERVAARLAVDDLRQTPIYFEENARPYLPRDLYRETLDQCDIFIGIYWQSYGWVAPGEKISGIEDEYRRSRDMPSLIYVKEPTPVREEKLRGLITEIKQASGVVTKTFSSPEELQELISEDLSLLFADQFDTKIDLPKRIYFERRRRVVKFIGRESELEEIRSRFEEPDLQAIAVHGLSGIGKTQLVLEYARRNKHHYEVVWTCRADSEASLVADMAELTKELQLPDFDVQDLARSASATKRWLESNAGWLLIVDGLHDQKLVELLPGPLHGNLLITSTRPDWGAFAFSLSLGGYSPDESISVLFSRTTDRNISAAHRVARSLGHLPLAIEQAAAFLEKQGVMLSGYEDLLFSSTAELMNRPSDLDPYPLTVLGALSLALNKAYEASPLSIEVLYVCSFLDSNGIPKSLIHRALQSFQQENGTQVDELEVVDAIGELLSYSLVDSSGDLLDIHPLVQTFSRHSIDSHLRKQYWQSAAITLYQDFPEFDDPHNSDIWPKLEELVGHVIAVSSFEEAKTELNPHFAAFLERAALYLSVRNQKIPARDLQERSMEISLQIFSPGNPTLAVRRANLASILDDLGELDRAIKMMEDSIVTLSRMKGRRIAIEQGKLQSNLANMLLASGNPKSALARAKRAYKIHRKYLGPVHESTAIDLNTIGRIYRATGDYESAYSYFSQAEEVHSQVNPVVDFPLSMALFNKATMAFNIGRQEESENLLREALDIQNAIFAGTGHPELIATVEALAFCLQARQKFCESLPLFERASAMVASEYGDVSERARVLTNRFNDAKQQCIQFMVGNAEE